MKKLIISCLVSLVLIATITAPAIADFDTGEEGVTASVTVSEHISATISDPGATGLDFGSLNPGVSDIPEVSQDGTGCITIVVAATTNVNCDIKVKADDFTGAGTIPVANAKYNTSNTIPATGFTAADTYESLGSSTAGALETVQVYHWLSIPVGQAPGAYSSTFTYQVIAQ